MVIVYYVMTTSSSLSNSSTCQKDGTENWEEEFNTLGYHVMKAIVARKEFIYHVTRDDLKKFSEFDTSIVRRSFPQDTHVLSIHGLRDKIVPPYVIFCILSFTLKSRYNDDF
jgi:hypothetical protein